jgi:hypothetical protein
MAVDGKNTGCTRRICRTAFVGGSPTVNHLRREGPSQWQAELPLQCCPSGQSVSSKHSTQCAFGESQRVRFETSAQSLSTRHSTQLPLATSHRDSAEFSQFLSVAHGVQASAAWGQAGGRGLALGGGSAEGAAE